MSLLTEDELVGSFSFTQASDPTKPTPCFYLMPEIVGFHRAAKDLCTTVQSERFRNSICSLTPGTENSAPLISLCSDEMVIKFRRYVVPSDLEKQRSEFKWSHDTNHQKMKVQKSYIDWYKKLFLNDICKAKAAGERRCESDAGSRSRSRGQTSGQQSVTPQGLRAAAGSAPYQDRLVSAAYTIGDRSTFQPLGEEALIRSLGYTVRSGPYSRSVARENGREVTSERWSGSIQKVDFGGHHVLGLPRIQASMFPHLGIPLTDNASFDEALGAFKEKFADIRSRLKSGSFKERMMRRFEKEHLKVSREAKRHGLELRSDVSFPLFSCSFAEEEARGQNGRCEIVEDLKLLEEFIFSMLLYWKPCRNSTAETNSLIESEEEEKELLKALQEVVPEESRPSLLVSSTVTTGSGSSNPNSSTWFDLFPPCRASVPPVSHKKRGGEANLEDQPGKSETQLKTKELKVPSERSTQCSEDGCASDPSPVSRKERSEEANPEDQPGTFGSQLATHKRKMPLDRSPQCSGPKTRRESLD